MKIGIVTHYNVHNHGALLQLYALSNILSKKGHDAKALTFTKNFDFLPPNMDKKYSISIKSIFWYISYLFKFGLSRTFFNYKKKRKLDKFRKPLIGEYYSRAKNLEKVFIGSDEVFSLEVGMNNIFYGFGIPCNQLYSYAGCFGPYTYEMIKKNNLISYVKAGFEIMNNISVRDENSRSIVEKISGKDPLVVCDPVILHGYFEESKLKTVRLPRKKYILIYSYDNNMNDKEEVRKIREFAKKHKLLLVSVGFYHKWCDKNINADPLELLQYFKNAEYVITDTFHGSVISLITESQFVTKIRTNSNKLMDLLIRYNTQEQVTSDFSNLDDLFASKINYSEINKLLENHRKLSMEYLDNCLTNI